MKDFFRKYWLKILLIALAALLLGFVVGFFCGEKIYIWLIRPFHNAEGQFDVSVFWTAIVGIGTLGLSFLALIQNERLNRINKKLSERNLQEKKGLFFPKKNEGESKKTNPYQDISCGNIFEADGLRKDCENTLLMTLQNRGDDFIYSLKVIQQSIDGFSTDYHQKSADGILVEIDETISFEFDITKQNELQQHAIDFMIIFEMKNSVGYKYYQIYECTIKRLNSNTFRVSKHNSVVKQSLKEDAVNG